MATCCTKTKLAKGCGCTSTAKNIPCKIKKTYATKLVCCGVKPTRTKCQNKCKFTFKKVKVLKSIERVPCSTSTTSCSTNCCVKKSCGC